MEILQNLDNEHRLLEDAAGSLVTLASEWTKNDSEEIRIEMKTMISFFIEFMVNYHTKKEEACLFSAFEKLKIPRDKGPLYFYELEHKQHLERANQFMELLEKKPLTDELKETINKLAIDYCSEIWEHIDKEDSVLFLEVPERIRGNIRLEMDKAYDNFHQEHKPDENLVNQVKSLIEKYKPVHAIPDVFRGDGCMSCRFYGEGCRGIEHEWWTEGEWEDFFESNQGE